MKKVLMISYSFPPKGGGGVLRQFKFAKYLPVFGWGPIVLTGDRYHFFQDNELLKELPPESSVCRIAYPDPRNFPLLRGIIGSNPGQDADNGEKQYLLKVILKNIFSYLKALLNMIVIPDIYIGWVPFAVLKGLWIIRKERVEVIYSIDNPHSNYLAAFILKLLTRKPWVCDFKDPWWGDFRYKYRKIFPFSLIEFQLNKLILLFCDYCVSSDERVQKRLRALIAPERWSKFFSIPNGFDADDFKEGPAPGGDGTFRIAYIGTVYRDMPPFSFLRAISNLIEKGDIPGNAIKIIFIGSHEYPQTRIEPLYQSLLKKGVVEEKGMLSHRDSIRNMQAADALLLISANVADSEYIAPSKIYEYLAARRSIIALVDEYGVCAKIIRRFNAGYVVAINQISKIEETVLALYRESKRSGVIRLEQNIGSLWEYERKNTCQALAGILTKAVS